MKQITSRKKIMQNEQKQFIKKKNDVIRKDKPLGYEAKNLLKKIVKISGRVFKPQQMFNQKSTFYIKLLSKSNGLY